MVVPVFLAVGNLAPIFSNIAFLQRNQKVSIDETPQYEHCRYLLRLPFAVFKRKSTTMFRSDSAADSRHVENFCGVIVSVHVLIRKNRWKQVGSWTQPLSHHSLSSLKMAEHFELLSSFVVLDSIPVKKYRSKRTGINFCFAEVPGPLVNGFLCLGKWPFNKSRHVADQWSFCKLSCETFLKHLLHAWTAVLFAVGK